MSPELENLIDVATVRFAFEQLKRELDAAGVTDPAKHERARLMLIEQLKVARAAREAVAAVKH